MYNVAFEEIGMALKSYSWVIRVLAGCSFLDALGILRLRVKMRTPHRKLGQ